MTSEAMHTTHDAHDHSHADQCGHRSRQHTDHVDYLHDGHTHRQHAEHWDECAGSDEAWGSMPAVDAVAPTDESKQATTRDKRAEELRTSTGS